jgi:hypothetical protein
MEKFFATLPKPILILGVLLSGVIVLFVLNPPHSVCDTVVDTFRESLKGVIYPRKEDKRTFPPKILQAQEVCEQGVTTGACFDYFAILKLVAKQISKAPKECAPNLYEISEVKKVIDIGIEKMILMAWGEQPPEPGPTRFGWFQEAEIALFCLLRGTLERSLGEEGVTAFRRKIFAKLPGSLPIVGKDPTQLAIAGDLAVSKFTEEEIWARSLFSVRCDNYQ